MKLESASQAQSSVEQESPLQIAGSTCKVCGCNVTFSSEGKFCGHCRTVVHLQCEPRATCEVCGQILQNYEPPQTDLLSTALLPRALRPAPSGGPALAIFVGGLLAFLAVLVWWILEYAAAHGK